MFGRKYEVIAMVKAPVRIGHEQDPFKSHLISTFVLLHFFC